ncbi:class I SAM-dependent methyltransferase [Exilibacterium tricleocarpae]|uniref:Class I SAM-dependent methyltransferase n=1 Tax=Exilibacterium tricleocarpae TaxID=2591008 RepID=A0A545SYW7_9GAMM|nr:class I SAM-dependent methyltransferase [Exilibacterium tricleocarpae]TQV70162.1 class I SAM-dependent methyltransferase [Exilibacterium tricleocarpae]
MFSDEKILDSWQKNVQPWTTAVRDKQIPSRNLVTDGAIVDAVAVAAGHTALDIGCGEGWLVRELAARGLSVTGLDAVADLIARARQCSDEDYLVLSYEALAREGLDRRFDLVVCNFSLLGDKSVEGVFGTVPALLNPGGSFIVQTIHPLVACGEYRYEDGWREGSWQGFSEDFTDPAPWYFRTLESWVAMFGRHNLVLSKIAEPLHPETGKPASILFTAQLRP